MRIVELEQSAEIVRSISSGSAIRNCFSKSHHQVAIRWMSDFIMLAIKGDLEPKCGQMQFGFSVHPPVAF